MAFIGNSFFLQPRICGRSRVGLFPFLGFGVWGVWLGFLACGGCGGEPRSPQDPLRVLLPREPLEIDPRFAADVYSLKVSRLLFASLVTIDPHTLKPIPDLAERIDEVSPTHYRVTLKPDLYFSDGSALDAHDVKATFAGVVSADLGSRYANTYRRISRIEVHSPLELSFFLEGAHATFVTDLELPILRQEDGLYPLGRDGAMPVVSGPYRLLTRERSELHFKANPRYHGSRPRFAEVVMRVVRDDNIRALRLLTAKADVALDAIPPLLLPLFEGEPGFEVVSAQGIGTTYLGINSTAPWLGDVRVRQALAHAVDRERIIARKLGGRARLANGFVPPGHWAHAADTPGYAYDTRQARALLKAAGVPQPLNLTLRCRSDRDVMSMARVVAAMLEDVGVQVTVQPSEPSTLLADLGKGRFELTFLQIPEVIEPHVLTWFFASSHIPGPGNEGANRWRFRSQALDTALAVGRVETGLEARRRAYRDVQHIMARQLPVVPLWHEDKVAVIGHRGHGFWVARHGRFDGLVR